MVVRTFTAILHKEEDLYVAECPEVGTASQGYTVEEALANLKEATELYLEEVPLHDVERPLVTTFEATSSSPDLFLLGISHEQRSTSYRYRHRS